MEGRITSANMALAVMLGHNAPELLIGKTVFQIGTLEECSSGGAPPVRAGARQNAYRIRGAHVCQDFVQGAQR